MSAFFSQFSPLDKYIKITPNIFIYSISVLFSLIFIHFGHENLPKLFISLGAFALYNNSNKEIAVMNYFWNLLYYMITLSEFDNNNMYILLFLSVVASVLIEATQRTTNTKNVRNIKKCVMFIISMLCIYKYIKKY